MNGLDTGDPFVYHNLGDLWEKSLNLSQAFSSYLWNEDNNTS